MRLRTKFLFLFLASSVFLLVEGLAAAWSLNLVGRDVEDLQIYTQADDICGQVKTELARIPDPQAVAAGPGQGKRQLTEHIDRALVLCRSLQKLTGSTRSQDALSRINSALLDYRRSGRAYAHALSAGRGGFKELDAAEPAFAELVRVRDGGDRTGRTRGPTRDQGRRGSG